MKRIIFAIHGVRSKKKDNWIYDFIDFAKTDPRFKDDIFVPYYYGFVLATGSALPVGRFNKIKKLMAALREKRNENPDCELNIVAHSYGTELSFQAIKRSGEDGKPPIIANKLILVASVVSRHREIPYNDTLKAGKIKQLHCYCNHADWVCNFNVFGHSGFAGFSRDKYDKHFYPRPIEGLEIYNHLAKGMGHGGYFKGTKYYQEWLNIIATS